MKYSETSSLNLKYMKDVLINQAFFLEFSEQVQNARREQIKLQITTCSWLEAQKEASANE